MAVNYGLSADWINSVPPPPNYNQAFQGMAGIFAQLGQGLAATQTGNQKIALQQQKLSMDNRDAMHKQTMELLSFNQAAADKRFDQSIEAIRSGMDTQIKQLQLNQLIRSVDEQAEKDQYMSRHADFRTRLATLTAPGGGSAVDMFFLSREVASMPGASKTQEGARLLEEMQLVMSRMGPDAQKTFNDVKALVDSGSFDEVRREAARTDSPLTRDYLLGVLQKDPNHYTKPIAALNELMNRPPEKILSPDEVKRYNAAQERLDNDLTDRIVSAKGNQYQIEKLKRDHSIAKTSLREAYYGSSNTSSDGVTAEAETLENIRSAKAVIDNRLSQSTVFTNSGLDPYLRFLNTDFMGTVVQPTTKIPSQSTPGDVQWKDADVVDKAVWASRYYADPAQGNNPEMAKKYESAVNVLTTKVEGKKLTDFLVGIQDSYGPETARQAVEEVLADKGFPVGAPLPTSIATAFGLTGEYARETEFTARTGKKIPDPLFPNVRAIDYYEVKTMTFDDWVKFRENQAKQPGFFDNMSEKEKARWQKETEQMRNYAITPWDVYTKSREIAERELTDENRKLQAEIASLMAERYDVNIPVEQTTQRLNNIAAGYASLIGVARKHGFPLQASTLEDYFPSRDHYRAFMEDYKQRGVNPYAVPGLVRPMTSPVINNSLTQQSQGTTVQPSAGATAGPVPTYKPVMISPQIGGMQ